MNQRTPKNSRYDLHGVTSCAPAVAFRVGPNTQYAASLEVLLL